MLACRSILLFLVLFSLLCLSHAGLTRKGMKEADLRKIEDEWMDDEVEDEDDTPFKWQKNSDGTRTPPAPGGPKTEMGFVTLSMSDRKETEKIAGRWSDQLVTGGVDVRGYTIEDNRILFVCDRYGYKDMNKAKNFILQQKETVEFEWNQKKYLPGVKGDLADAVDPNGGTPDPMAKFQEMQDEQAAAQRRKERKARKKREERKRKKAAEKKRKEREAKKKAEEAKKAAEAAAAQQKTEL